MTTIGWKRALALLSLVGMLGLSGCGESGPAATGGSAAVQPKAAAAGAPVVLDKNGASPSAGAIDPATALIAEKDGAGSAPVYRFAKISNGAYFFTGDAGEKNQILESFPDFRCEGLAFFRTADGSGVPVYRFANLGNGGYFYTASEAERDFVKATRPDMRFEGSTFSVVSSGTTGAQPVYRLANLNNGAYLFTVNAAERDFAVGLGFWRNEGIAFYGAARDEAQAAINPCVRPGAVPVVASVSASILPLKYLAPTTFRVTGSNLDAGISFTATACTGITEVAGGTATLRTFTCSPSALGTISFKVLGPSGNQLWGVDSAVPQPQVKVATSKGDMVIQLDPVKAPITVANFLQYVRDGFYSGLIFHRVVRSASFSIIQGGGVLPNLQIKPPRSPIVLESQNGLSNVRGSIGMARTSAPNTATSQFFINTTDNLGFNYLNAANPGYAVFGSVVQGLEVMDAIGAVQTGTVSGVPDVPVEPVLINSVTQTQ